ncbi:MAG: hypothetical protein KAJ19_12960 [Gammaproteobacteria bacterium]|nr:hypothetical protein [Gammaproteobacteria bacterium]
MPSVLELAESDLAITLEDEGGTGRPLTITDPQGNSGSVNGQLIDIGSVIDPNTGMAVSGRFRGVTLRISSLSGQGLGIPEATEQGQGWLITDPSGENLEIHSSAPDRTLGVVSLVLKASTAVTP